ncbi:MAG: hypothetical protein JNM63_03830, partial [Spirochaetia bacterium]|nr:hypothetical protein [Spirochaetia bacterium]
MKNSDWPFPSPRLRVSLFDIFPDSLNGRSLRLVSSLLLLSLLLANVAFAETKLDPESAKMVRLLKAMFSKEGLFGEIKPSPTPVSDTYDATPLPANIAAGDLENALTLFSKSFYLKEFMGSASVESDTFLLPNGALAKINTEWTSIKTLSGKEVRGPKAKDSDMMVFSKIALAGYSDKDPLSEARGICQLSLPV